jgi:hypothetical protein
VLVAAVQHVPSPVVFDAFKSGKEGYACYRIPVMLRLPNGNIALYAEGRKLNCDDHGWVDVVFKISADNGKTFGPLHRLYGESTNTSHVTIGNPAPLSIDGKVVMLFCRNNQRLLTMTSSDAAGLVWPTTATDITETTFANASKSMTCTAGALEVDNPLLRVVSSSSPMHLDISPLGWRRYLPSQPHTSGCQCLVCKPSELQRLHHQKRHLLLFVSDTTNCPPRLLLQEPLDDQH